MSYFPLRDKIEEAIEKHGLSNGVVWIHAKGATPAIIIARDNDLDLIDKWLRENIPVYGWRHGNAYAHLRSTVLSTVKPIVFKNRKLMIPKEYNVFFLETRPVYNHKRTIHLWITGD
ncbi:YjbQ family protein [Desulfurococcaceae archaeon MEX13E-LK6-19]|nr:YjbQ family protein [Desulfurococcaceae archaeon MEX13E-LK6-19]